MACCLVSVYEFLWENYHGSEVADRIPTFWMLCWQLMRRPRQKQFVAKSCGQITFSLTDFHVGLRIFHGLRNYRDTFWLIVLLSKKCTVRSSRAIMITLQGTDWQIQGSLGSNM